MFMHLEKNYSEKEKDVRQYMDNVFASVKQRDPHETEFHQSVQLLIDSLIPIYVKDSTYMDNGILERLVEPERIISFQVPWINDKDKVKVNRGYRVQFNSAIGPYKGGLRFHPTVNTSVMKFLGFQQTFKNALTGQAIGGAKGGADFDPKGKSDMEIMRFCQSFMTELARYLGPNIDIPAGDIGVGAKEIGYMFGQYKRLQGSYDAGVLTGKGISYGGSIGRTEATGYGAIYFVEEMLKEQDMSMDGSSVIVSGSGNVAIYAMEKAIKLGAKVIACSDSNGYVYDRNGLSLNTIKRIKIDESRRISDYVKIHPEAKYNEGCSGIWSVPCDIALPCATQNELNKEAAQKLVDNGVKVVAEGANMPSTMDALDIFISSDVLFGPAQAVNAGGVAVSALEMAQNSSKVAWSFEKVDEKLHDIMKDIYRDCTRAANEHGYPGNLVKGVNIASFTRLANVMIELGV